MIGKLADRIGFSGFAAILAIILASVALIVPQSYIAGPLMGYAAGCLIIAAWELVMGWRRR